MIEGVDTIIKVGGGGDLVIMALHEMCENFCPES